MNRSNVLPKFEIPAREILEITDDYRRSKTLFESISEEWKEMVDAGDDNKHKDDVNWKFFTEVKEHLVSTSPVTCIDSHGDFVTYGTEHGAVGLLIAGHSLNLIRVSVIEFPINIIFVFVVIPGFHGVT